MAKLLIVDDDSDFLELTARRLERAGHELETCVELDSTPSMSVRAREARN